MSTPPGPKSGGSGAAGDGGVFRRPGMSGSRRIAVVGGGLAGITAALALAEAGLPVSLYEARPRLGGATTSFQRDGLTVDNGQHVFLRCCTAYRELLNRLGTARHVVVQDRFDVPVLAPDGRAGRLRRGRLPGPFHLLPALAGYSLLDRNDRLRSLRAAFALATADPADPELDAIDLETWLAGHGQREPARRLLWDLFAVAALNIGMEEAAVGPAAHVFRTALFGRAGAADIGVPTVPLDRLHAAAARTAIEAAGGRVHLSAKVKAVEPGPTILLDGVREEAAAVVVAVPHQEAAAVVPQEAAPDRDRWGGLGASPIVNVHVIYDRPVTGAPFTAVVNSPVQWVFDRTGVAGLGGGRRTGQYLAVSVSAARRWIDLPAAEVRAVFEPALAQLFPAARDARVVDFFVTRERRATFQQGPGSGALRPDAVTRWPGLYLAGAWTATGWPDTMEGAVRSGLTAARLVRRHFGREP
jgi:squalene-associated FAD-dependent desaturase